MGRDLRWLGPGIGLLAIVGGASSARADTPCGTFDFSQGVSCKIEVEASCSAGCTPIKLEAGCSGGCTASATTSCVNDCGAQCIATCDPEALDCFAGCHAECDQPTIDACQAKQPDADCVSAAKAQCDVHCKDACQVPDSSCQEHCNKCCSGSCTTQVNFDCDFACFAKLEGSCNVQCDDPKGALFCNGQYVGASDVDACIQYLATQGVDVDVSARGSIKCDGSGCTTEALASGASTGCSAAAPADTSFGGAALALVLAGGAVGFARRRRRG